MSMLSFVYTEFKKDGFRPRNEAAGMGPNDDISIMLHMDEVPECYWWFQYQKRINFNKPATAWWSLYGGRWVLI